MIVSIVSPKIPGVEGRYTSFSFELRGCYKNSHTDPHNPPSVYRLPPMYSHNHPRTIPQNVGGKNRWISHSHPHTVGGAPSVHSVQKAW